MDECLICGRILYDNEDTVIIGNSQRQVFNCHASCAETWVQSGKIKEKVELSDLTDESIEPTPSYDLSSDHYENTSSLLQAKLQKLGITQSQADAKFKQMAVKEPVSYEDGTISSSYDFSSDTPRGDHIPLIKKKNKYLRFYIIIAILSSIIIFFGIWFTTCFSLRSTHNLTICW